MKNFIKMLFNFLSVSVIVILLCFTAFAENDGVYYPDAETTKATKTETETSKNAIDKFLDDSGLGDVANDIADSVNTDNLSGIGDTISNALGGITDRLSDTLNSYSSSIDSLFSGSSGETTTQTNSNGNSYSQFVVATSPSGNTVNSTSTTAPAETTTAVPVQNNVTEQTNNYVYTTSPTRQTETVQAKSDSSNGIWIFIVSVFAVVFIILFVLILITRQTQYNSRVYDKSTLKSVKKSHPNEGIIDDDGDPLDNIFPN